MRRAAHTIKGSTRIFGHDTVSELSKMLEDRGVKADFSDATPLANFNRAEQTESRPVTVRRVMLDSVWIEVDQFPLAIDENFSNQHSLIVTRQPISP